MFLVQDVLYNNCTYETTKFHIFNSSHAYQNEVFRFFKKSVSQPVLLIHGSTSLANYVKCH